MTQFLTLSEAARNYSGSRSSLRRFVERIVAGDGSDRELIRPSAEDVRKLKERKQPFAWRVSEELLSRHFQPRKAETESEPAAGDSAEVLRQLLEAKERHLKNVTDQLKIKDEQIKALNERVFEGNVLMKQMQDRLALPESDSPKRRGFLGMFR